MIRDVQDIVNSVNNGCKYVSHKMHEVAHHVHSVNVLQSKGSIVK